MDIRILNDASEINAFKKKAICEISKKTTWIEFKNNTINNVDNDKTKSLLYSIVFYFELKTYTWRFSMVIFFEWKKITQGRLNTVGNVWRARKSHNLTEIWWNESYLVNYCHWLSASCRERPWVPSFVIYDRSWWK